MVLDYPRRADIWQALPYSSRDVCLASTAEAWAKLLPDRVSQADYLDPEHEFAIALASPKMLQEMKAALELLQFEIVLKVFTGNTHLLEVLFAEVFATYYRSDRRSSSEELERIARLVVARDWRNFTQSLWKRYGMTDDLCVYFHICADHLDFGIDYCIGLLDRQRASFTTFWSKPPANFIPQAQCMARFGLGLTVVLRNSISPGPDSGNGTQPFGKFVTVTKCAQHL